MTSTPPPRSPLAVLQAHDRATTARVLPALDRANRADLDALQVLARAPRGHGSTPRPGPGMTPPPDGLAAVLEKVADALEECADSLDALDRTDDQKSEKHHNG